MPYSNHPSDENYHQSWIFGAFLASLLCFSWFEYREDKAFTEQMEKAQQILMQLQNQSDQARSYPIEKRDQAIASHSSLLYASLPNISDFQNYNQVYARSQQHLQKYYTQIMRYEDLRHEAKNRLLVLNELVFWLMDPDTAYYRRDILPMYRVWSDLLEMAELRGRTMDPEERSHLQNLMSQNQSYSLFLVKRNLQDPMSPVFGLPQISEIEEKWREYNNIVFEIYETDNSIAQSREVLQKTQATLISSLKNGIQKRFSSHEKTAGIFLLSSVILLSLMLGMLWPAFRKNLDTTNRKWLVDTLRIIKNTGKLDKEIHSMDVWGGNLADLRYKSEQLRKITQDLAESEKPAQKAKLEEMLKSMLILEDEISKRLNSAMSDYQQHSDSLSGLIENLKSELTYFQSNLNEKQPSEDGILLQARSPEE